MDLAGGIDFCLLASFVVCTSLLEPSGAVSAASAAVDMPGGIGFFLLASFVLGELPGHGGSRLRRDSRRSLHECRGTLFSMLCPQAGPLPLQRKAVLQKNWLYLSSGVHVSRDRDEPKLQHSAVAQRGLGNAQAAPV